MVEFLPDCRLHYSRAHQTIHNIADEGEIPRRLAIPGDRQWLSFHRPIDEVWNYVTVLARDLARPVGVEKTRLDHFQVVMVPKEITVKLPQHFRDLVGRREVERHELFSKRQGR